MDGGLRVQYPIFTSDAVFWQARRESKIHERCKNIPRYNILNPPIRYIYHSNRRVQNCERLLKTRMRDIQTWFFPRALSKVVWICQTDLLNKSFFFFLCLRTLSHLYYLYCHMGMCIFTGINSSPLIISEAVSSDKEMLSLMLFFCLVIYYYYYYYYIVNYYIIIIIIIIIITRFIFKSIPWIPLSQIPFPDSGRKIRVCR